MRPQLWEQIERLFGQLITLAPADRPAFLDRECASDPELRAELESLLQAHVDEEGPLDAPPPIAEVAAESADTGLSAGSRVGPYVLISPIAEGGMGTVWLAERADGLMKRRVALKLPHWSWVRPELAARMARERDFLAALEHPNIARLYDAGVDSFGRPYLAMEYVEGQAIDAYCEREKLSFRARIELILQVARAVSHAHGRLIVHRDLKPSNILVTPEGSVRLLDFGIATILETNAGPRETRLTQLGARILTPDYASPEQVLGQPIGTATDVYSLAVVTYELLTGRKPYRLKRRSAAELEDAIATADPMPASDAPGDHTRKRLLRGDVDAILNKALKKNPAERYATLDAFAQDLQRYLDGKAVQARPDSTLYRFGKFASRNRLALSVAAMVAVALVAATVFSIWQAGVAEKQRNRAVALLARNEAVNDFVSVMLTEVGSPDQPITLDALLERSEALIYSSITNNPEHQAVMLQLLASYYSSFALPAKAERLLEKALELSQKSDDLALRARLTCAFQFARSQLGGMDEAKQTLQRIIDDPKTPPEAAANCLQHRAFIAQNTNDAAAALKYSLLSQQVLAKAERHDPALEADILGDIGYGYHLSGKPKEAERYFAESLRKFTELGRGEHAVTVPIRNNWAMSVVAHGDLHRALGMYDEAVRVAKLHAAGGEVPVYLLANRALALADVGRYEEALAEYDKVIEAGVRTSNTQFRVVGLNGKAKVCIDTQNFDCAEQWYALARAAMGNHVPPDSPSGMNMALLEARIAAGRNRYSESEAIFTRIVDFWDSRQMVIASTSSALRGRAQVRLQSGNAAGALPDAERALSISRKLQSERPYFRETGFSLMLLSRVHASLGDKAKAAAEAREALTQLEKSLGADHPFTKQARELVEGLARDGATPAPVPSRDVRSVSTS